ncbi:MAG: hypothetical protein R3B84_24400 [Zavarzinella sp.]
MASDPRYTEWQRDLYVSHWRVADALGKLADADSIKHWRQAHDILQGIVDRGLFVSPSDREELKQIKAKLGKEK